jgi:hypothetical protein
MTFARTIFATLVGAAANTGFIFFALPNINPPLNAAEVYGVIAGMDFLAGIMAWALIPMKSGVRRK